MIKRLDEMVELVKSTGKKYRIAVAWAQDANTLGAVKQAYDEGFVDPILIGIPAEISRAAELAGVNISGLKIAEVRNDSEACTMAVELARTGDADVVMKGLVGTDKLLKAVMDKDKGILPPKTVMSYVCAFEMPSYHKLLFMTDPAVIPFPDLDQKVAMTNYAIGMANRFGIENPKVALIGPSEKVSRHFENSVEYSVMCKMSERGQIKKCIMDGPLDLFLACDPQSVEIKGIPTPVNGDADILIFPNLESSNPFYKSLMLFGGAELAGMICGPVKPVVVMSRSESEKSKFYCITLSCLMA